MTAWLRDGADATRALCGPDAHLSGRVVLLDVDLPGADGVGVLRGLRSDGALRGTRVIMLTARSSEDEILETLTLDAFDHVAKPFSLPVLMHKVRRALAA